MLSRGYLVGEIIDLDLDRLHRLHILVKRDIVKVKVELEIPDESGEYKTSAYKFLEATAKQKIGTIHNFVNYLEENSGEKLSQTLVHEYMDGLHKLGTLHAWV